MQVAGSASERDTKAKMVAQSLYRRGVRSSDFETMHSTMRQHYARAHGIDDDDEEMWGAVAGHMNRISSGML